MRAVFLCVSMFVLVFLCGSCTQEKPPTIRVGLNAWPGYEFMYLAQEKGYYREVGLDVVLVELNSLADIRRAFEKGQINVLGTTVLLMLQSREKSPRQAQIIHVIDYSNGADVIIARSKFQDFKTLKGAKVGVEAGSISLALLAQALKKSQMSFSDIQLVLAEELVINRDFRVGKLDALVTFPPNSVALIRDTDAHQVFSSADSPGAVLDVIAADSKLINSHPELLRKFLTAVQKAVTYHHQHPSNANTIMATREGITPNEFSQALSSIKILGSADQAAYLSANGLINLHIDNTDQVLRDSGQLSGADHRRDIVDPAILVRLSH